MYDQPLCIKGFIWKSRNSDAFSVGVPQLEITDLPGTLYIYIYIHDICTLYIYIYIYIYI